MNTKNLAISLALVALTGCAAPHAKNPADPFEGFNRGVYQFNDTVDKAIAKPVAQGYNKVMPDLGKTMVTNFFSNLNDVVVTANDLLQFKFIQALSDGMRVLVNSTVGVGGLIDVASMHLEKHNEDFGQTLGYWGIGSGPYLMLPILGPSSFRDGIGDLGDSQISPVSNTYPIRTRNQMYLTRGINRRADLLSDENVMDGAIIDRYSFIRDAYLQRRQSLVCDGKLPHDNYEDDSDSIDEPAAPAVPATPATPATPEVSKPQSSIQPPPAENGMPVTSIEKPAVYKYWAASSN
jgi:phospholipid-binding lipoprotein MlaA